MSNKIPKRMTTAILQSFSAGVVPRIGLEHIAVGRKDEITAILDDLDNIVGDGGASFKLLLGRYGSGKSFLCQLIRNYAMQRNFVVADADLNPERRLTGTKGHGLNLYRELLNNLSTRTRPDGNAFPAILERWISTIQNEVIQAGISPDDPRFTTTVENRIRQVIEDMEGMVHGYDFGNVINAYWRGHQSGDDALKSAALRWLRGEFSNKTEAREALNVRVIIEDDSWYDYVKLLAHFVQTIGYKGLVIFIDEAVNLYKISNAVSRRNNYERLLSILNDTLQGKAQYLAVIIGGTPQMVEDTHRGLYSYEALKTRLAESRFAKNGYRDLSSPLIRLDVLSPEEIFLLLQRLQEVHAIHHNISPKLSNAQIQTFMGEVLNRLGADQMLTPRDVVRDFVALLNILHHNPEASFESVLNSSDFEVTRSSYDPEVLSAATEIHDDESPYKSFNL